MDSKPSKTKYSPRQIVEDIFPLYKEFQGIRRDINESYRSRVDIEEGQIFPPVSLDSLSYIHSRIKKLEREMKNYPKIFESHLELLAKLCSPLENLSLEILEKLDGSSSDFHETYYELPKEDEDEDNAF